MKNRTEKWPVWSRIREKVGGEAEGRLKGRRMVYSVVPLRCGSLGKMSSRLELGTRKTGDWKLGKISNGFKSRRRTIRQVMCWCETRVGI
jgi:hypothetical protein